jgi:hypothetical protein
MDEGGSTREDLTLPTGTEEADKLAEQIKDMFHGGQELAVTVLKVSCTLLGLGSRCCAPPGIQLCCFLQAMDIEMISSIKVINTGAS